MTHSTQEPGSNMASGPREPDSVPDTPAQCDWPRSWSLNLVQPSLHLRSPVIDDQREWGQQSPQARGPVHALETHSFIGFNCSSIRYLWTEPAVVAGPCPPLRDDGFPWSVYRPGPQQAELQGVSTPAGEGNPSVSWAGCA